MLDPQPMPLSLMAAFGWLIAANLAGWLPSKRHHWPHAYVLIAAGLPVLAWVAATNPWWMTAALIAAASSVLRWPVRYAGRWIARRLGRAA